MNNKIDFVMIWVDGNDPEWRKEKDKYSNNVDNNTDNREARFRDWDNLQYWFRGVEKFAPWVNSFRNMWTFAKMVKYRKSKIKYCKT